MMFSSKKNLEKVVELVAQIAASERSRKLAAQSNKVAVTGHTGSMLSCFLSSWSFFQSYEICLLGTKSTKHLFHGPVSQCLSLEYPRENRAVQANLKPGRQI